MTTWRCRRELQPKGKPEKVKVHDFIDPNEGKAIPYGIYDLAKNLRNRGQATSFRRLLDCRKGCLLAGRKQLVACPQFPVYVLSAVGPWANPVWLRVLRVATSQNNMERTVKKWQ